LQTGEIREFNAIDVALFKYEDEAIKDVLSISEVIRKEGIYTVVVNAIPSSSGLPATSGSITARMIASATDGIYYETSSGIAKSNEASAGEISESILRAQKNISHFHYLTSKTRAR
jgi:hypothetical protein